MILLDDNFSSLVKGVEEGRIVYDNSKKATKFLLASNFCEILIIFYSILLKLPLPILPLQILWINLVTDAIPALALTREKGEEVMEGKPRKEKSMLSNIFWFVILAGVVSIIFEIIILHYGLANLTIEKTRTMVMMTMIGFEAFFVFSCRSSKPINKIGLFSNKYVNYAFLSIIILQLILIYTPLAPLFGIASLTLKEWLYVFLASIPGFLIFEFGKFVISRKK